MIRNIFILLLSLLIFSCFNITKKNNSNLIKKEIDIDDPNYNDVYNENFTSQYNTKGVIIDSRFSIREMPYHNSKIIKTNLKIGDSINIIEKTKLFDTDDTFNKYHWYQIRVNWKKCWIYGKYFIEDRMFYNNKIFGILTKGLQYSGHFYGNDLESLVVEDEEHLVIFDINHKKLILNYTIKNRFTNVYFLKIDDKLYDKKICLFLKLNEHAFGNVPDYYYEKMIILNEDYTYFNDLDFLSLYTNYDYYNKKISLNKYWTDNKKLYFSYNLDFKDSSINFNKYLNPYNFPII